MPDALWRAMAQPVLHHITQAFKAALACVPQGPRWLCQTQQKVICLCGTATLGMEASACDFLAPEQSALYADAGKFGERWGDIFNRANGCRGVPIKVALGPRSHT